MFRLCLTNAKYGKFVFSVIYFMLLALILFILPIIEIKDKNIIFGIM